MKDSKTTQLKKMLLSSELEFIMEAHNGLSAKIAEEAGFKGLWGSGLSISAALGVRDNNEASWTQVLEVMEFMSDATTIPILLDGDTGYGNFNNMRRLVAKLEQRGVAGVCIEDKIFPKTNSFIRTDVQPMADVDEFCGKIKAGVDSRKDQDFCIVARVESLICGWGLKEALKRAEAYRLAGADAILIHSKKSSADEILAFSREWANRAPLVIVPTKYYSTPTQVFREHKISLVIWANHLLRSGITAMQNTSAQIYKSQTLVHVEDKIATVNEIFRLQNDEELMQAEKIYLKTVESEKLNVIVLAASSGVGLKELTDDRPKALIEIQGRPIIERMLGQFYDKGIKDISIVRGHRKESFQYPNIHYFDNDRYEETGELFSLFQAREKINEQGPCLISYGDILYRNFILTSLLEDKGDIVIVVDCNEERQAKRKKGYQGDFVKSSRPNDKTYLGNLSGPVFLKSIQFATPEASSSTFDGEWIGLIKASTKGAQIISKTLQELHANGDKEFSRMQMPHLLNRILEKDFPIHVMYIDGHWLDIDQLSDISEGHKF